MKFIYVVNYWPVHDDAADVPVGYFKSGAELFADVFRSEFDIGRATILVVIDRDVLLHLAEHAYLRVHGFVTDRPRDDERRTGLLGHGFGGKDGRTSHERAKLLGQDGVRLQVLYERAVHVNQLNKPRARILTICLRLEYKAGRRNGRGSKLPFGLPYSNARAYGV